MVGYALTTLLRHRDAARWMADWPGRPGVCPWMLINLVLALRGLGREADAGRVSRHALGLPADSCTPLHRPLACPWTSSLEGRSGEASARLDGIDPRRSSRPTATSTDWR